jgi:hypothetical protein
LPNFDFFVEMMNGPWPQNEYASPSEIELKIQ